MKAFAGGFLDFIAGFRLLGVPAIRKWAIFPMALNALLLAGLVALVFVFAGDVARLAATPGGFWHTTLYIFAWIGFVVVALALSVVVMILLSNVVAAPFYTKLAEAALLHLAGREVKQSGSIAAIALVTVWGQIQKLLIFIAIQFFAFPLGLIPVLGPFISAIVTMLLLAFEFSDYSLEAYDHTVTERWKFIASHKLSSLGFGAAAFLVALVPLALIAVAPVAVAGAAKMVVRLKGESLPIRA